MKSNLADGHCVFLNLACGAKVSSIGEWKNVDFASPLVDVIEMDILKGLHFKDNSFDAVYSAQFMEHLTLEQAKIVLIEVNRVLKPGGTLRLVTPDLEEITRSYLSTLEILKIDNNTSLKNQYDWLRLEIFDQVARDNPGGEMTKFFMEVDPKKDDYLTQRIGHTYLSSIGIESKPTLSLMDILRKLPRKVKHWLTLIFTSRDAKVGKFRRSGEVHRYLHDFFSLTQILTQINFVEISRQDPYSSTIVDWEKYSLDIVKGVVDAPKSLYVEAKKRQN